MFRRIGFLALALMLAVPFSASAIQLTDYTFPDTYYQEAYFNSYFDLRHGNQPQTSYNGSANLDYQLVYDTLPQSFTFNAGGNIDFEQAKEKTPNTDDRREGYSVYANPYYKRYYKDTNYFGYGSADFSYKKEKTADSADDPYLEIEGGIGYGRIITATPLAKAIRIIEELRKYNVVTAEPSDACYLEVARMIDKEPEFKSKWGLKDYEQYWYKEIEDILNKEGLLKNGVLGVVGVLRLREVFFNESNMGSLLISHNEFFSSGSWPRYGHGWEVKAGVGYIISNYEGQDEDPILTASFRYELPITNRLQFIEFFKYQTVLGNDLGHEFGNRMGLSYKLLDNIVWLNIWEVTMALPKDSEERKIIEHTFASDFIYEITNTLSADLKLSLHHNNKDDAQNELDKRIQFGFTYRLW